jgi:hypothetical protein
MRRYDMPYGQPWDLPQPRGGWGHFAGGRRGYDRGVYGDAYPGYGGRPGGDAQGFYYGGAGDGYRGGYDRERHARGGYDRGSHPGEGYTGDFARTPFLPEQAYRRHPEYARGRAERPSSRWDRYDEDEAYGLDDRQVLRRVQHRLYEDVWLDVDRIRVEVEDGVVTLTGEVDDFMEARYAWDDAWESPGVRGVVNNLTVRTDLPQDETHGDLVPQTARGNRTADEMEEGESDAAG